MPRNLNDEIRKLSPADRRKVEARAAALIAEQKQLVPPLKARGYRELVELFPLRPIRNEKQLDRATAMLHRLLDRGKLKRDERDYLEVLGYCIHWYESEHHPILENKKAEEAYERKRRRATTRTRRSNRD